MKISRPLVPIVIALSVAIGLSACSPAKVIVPVAQPTEESQAPTSAPTSDAPDDTTSSAPAVDGSAAAWANPVTTPGTLLTTAKGKDFKVDIYEVGTATASKTGQFVDPDTNKPIIGVGDTVVYVNYVVTNTGSATIPLGYSLVDVSARYADWKYLQGMDSVVDSAQRKSMNVNDSGLGTGGGDAPFAWAPGQSFSFGENFKYQANSPITFKASLTPVDASGDLQHDLNEEVSVDSTIK